MQKFMVEIIKNNYEYLNGLYKLRLNKNNEMSNLMFVPCYFCLPLS